MVFGAVYGSAVFKGEAIDGLDTLVKDFFDVSYLENTSGFVEDSQGHFFKPSFAISAIGSGGFAFASSNFAFTN